MPDLHRLRSFEPEGILEAEKIEERLSVADEWYQALRLGERVADSPGEMQDIPFDRERAAKRLARWRGQAPFTEDGHFERRLAVEGLRPEDLAVLLGEEARHLRERHGKVPGWLSEIEEAFAAPPDGPFPWPEADRPGSGSSADFLSLVEPLIRRGHDRLRRRIEELASTAPPGLDLAPATTLSCLLPHLTRDLRQRLARTLVLELQAVRLDEGLSGETPEERFRSFVARLSRPETALEILGRYPVLARHVVERIARWEAVCGEMLDRLAADWEEIRGHLGPERAPGPLAEVRIEGDPHRGGRSVFLLLFESGFRLVYKPKPLAADVAFQDLLRWIGGHGFGPGFRNLRVLDRGAYGWMEFIEACPCRTREEIHRFYQRQGGLMALLYLIGAIDFHHENLIACGEHPVLIDLETLFHPDLEARELTPDRERPGSSLWDSVLRIGLLPRRVWGDAERQGVDLSGLGAAGGAGTAIPYWGAVHVGTDEMRFGPREIELPGTTNRPSVEGEDVFYLDYEEDILDGFGQVYEIFRLNREEMLSPQGPLVAFADVEVRLIFRVTRAYFGLFEKSLHPYVLSNALNRARFLDQLWAGVPVRPFLEPIVPSEQRDLEQGDIPYFTTRPGSRDVWTSTRERLPDFLPDTGLERTALRLERLGEADRARQEWLIRGSFSAARLQQVGTGRPAYAFQEASEPASRERLLDAARAAAGRLCTLAFEESGGANWTSIEHGDLGWSFQGMNPDFYLGLPGVAFALGYVGALTGDEAPTRLARLALDGQRQTLAAAPDIVPGIGGFQGWGGVIYCLAHLGALWGDETLLDEAEALALDLGPKIDQDEHNDIIAGTAGCLLALLSLQRVKPSERLRQLTLRCGERLIDAARPRERGLGWVSPIVGPQPIGGLSHGASGIALALFRLWQESGDERFRRTALEGFEFERSLYSPEHRNWIDLRAGAAEMATDEASLYPCGWCHGAPGIGLARVAVLPFHSGSEVVEEIDAAVEATLAHGFGKNHSLCHGDLGNLDLLVEAARIRRDEALQNRVDRVAGGILQGIEEHGWLYGLPIGAEPLGLMVGLAGIAYELARLAAPDRLPCVLTLSPPPVEDGV
jgi:type 2 lantibiotic biosynthesis protein LanM